MTAFRRIVARAGLAFFMLPAFAEASQVLPGNGQATSGSHEVDLASAPVQVVQAQLQAAQSAAAGVSIDEMLGQMLLVGFNGTKVNDSGTKIVRNLLRTGKIGGVLLLGNNVRSPRQLKTLTSALYGARAKHMPLITIDQEGGLVQRMNRRKGFGGLPSAKVVSRKGVKYADQVYSRAAGELAAYGVNVNFGPVVDLAVNPQSPIITKIGRSYGKNPLTVSAYAKSFVKAHRAKGILTSVKHFPGHGSAWSDTHKKVTVITSTWHPAELEPYTDMIRNQMVDMIMIGHLIHPQFSDNMRPASLSRKASSYLRRLGYRGLLITDDLEMGAILKQYSLPEAAVLAARAGNDLLIVAAGAGVSGKVKRIRAAMKQAVSDGRIPVSQIRASYLRIIATKQRMQRQRRLVRN